MSNGDNKKRSSVAAVLRKVVSVEVDYTLTERGSRFAAWLTLECGHKTMQVGKRGLVYTPPPAAEDYRATKPRRCIDCVCETRRRRIVVRA